MSQTQNRAHNFSAGPAVLPATVIAELQDALPNFQGTGQGLMELSHRSATFDEVITGAQSRLRQLLNIPQDYEILFLQGGASLQFYMLPLNLLTPDEIGSYISTGTWSVKAIKEAARCAKVHTSWEPESTVFNRVPGDSELLQETSAVYTHYTSNNTIFGTQFHRIPSSSSHIVSDLSSDICSRPIDISAHDVIYAGAQKNLGPSGVTAVILSPWAVEKSRYVASVRAGGLPSMLSYGLMVDKGSMFNTPNTFGIFALERMLAWLQELGGVNAIAEINQQKAEALYGVLDSSDFWVPHATKDSRSLMNVTWRIEQQQLESVFLEEAEKVGLKALKGHRSVGGIRASIYNACPLESVQALCQFMTNFERKHG